MNYKSLYRMSVEKRLSKPSEKAILTPEEIASLPEPVQKYLVFTGAVGKPKVANMRVVFSGSMKRSIKSPWMPILSQQYNFFDDYARFFYIRAKLFGIPFDGLHAYSEDRATMQIKIASLFQVVDAKGEKMFKGETVTVLNDICLLAPAAMVDEHIQWVTLDDLQVKAIFSHRGVKVSAVLTFAEDGRLVDFLSDDRCYCEDGKNYLIYPWSTPIRRYAEVDGRMVPAYGEAIWHLPEAEYCYAKFDLSEIKYNCTEFMYT